MNEENSNQPTPPWRNKSDAPTGQPGAPMQPEQPTSGLEAFLTRPGSAWAPIGVGFAGGFGAAALFLIFVSVITKVRTMEDSYLWSIYGGVALLGLILWSWFLSRVRIYRSQAQDPDFSSYKKKSKRRRRGRRNPETEEDDEEPEEDEDDKPWI
jgi:hypothetical protein